MSDNTPKNDNKPTSAKTEFCRVVEIISLLSPKINSSDQVYCTLSNGQDGGLVFNLRHRVVRAFLVFKYVEAHGAQPTMQRIEEAISFVEGKLLNERLEKRQTESQGVFNCLIELLESEGNIFARASTILQQLQSIAQRNPHLLGNDTLPRFGNSMAKWLARNQLELRRFAIEATPQRDSTKRSWSLRLLNSDAKTASKPEYEQEVKENEKRAADRLRNRIRRDKDSK